MEPTNVIIVPTSLQMESLISFEMDMTLLEQYLRMAQKYLSYGEKLLP